MNALKFFVIALVAIMVGSAFASVVNASVEHPNVEPEAEANDPVDVEDRGIEAQRHEPPSDIDPKFINGAHERECERESPFREPPRLEHKLPWRDGEVAHGERFGELGHPYTQPFEDERCFGEPHLEREFDRDRFAQSGVSRCAPPPEIDWARYEAHDPIAIDGNSDFAAQASSEGWAGDGTEGEPYVIEGYDIDASTDEGIEIRNTDVYFIIRNSVIHNGDCGIYFYNVTNGKIENLTSHNSSWNCIVLDLSSYNQITNCAAYNNEGHGIVLLDSSNNAMANCTVYNTRLFSGICLFSSSNNQIADCALHNNFRGFGLHSSSNNNVTNCAVYNNYNGLYLGSSSNNKIHYNNIYNNTNYGVYNSNSDSQYVVSATYNWWGSIDGPSGVGPGSGDAVNENVLYDPWLTEPWEGGEVNLPPTVSFTYTPSSPTTSDTIQFTDTSTDSDGTIQSWSWEFGDGATSTLQNPTHQYSADGTYYVNLTVTDDDGGSGECPKQITVRSHITPHAPIYIDGNSNFASQACNEGWGGDGTQNNPYIIDKYDIDASQGSYAAIYIRNTDVYFIIRNCIIHNGTSNGKYGVYFYHNVFNGKIENCEIYNNFYGIYLYSSSNNIITNCTVHNNSDFGIILYAYSNTITNCAVYDNSGDGIYLYSSSNNNVTNCAVYNNSGNGIYLWYYSKNNQITNCTVYNNSDGIYLYYASNNEIHYCNIYNNIDHGVYSSGYSVNAINNWWGSIDGPSGVGPGSGDAVNENVLYDPWLTEPNPDAGWQPPENLPPTASFTYTPSNPTTSDTVQFTDASTDTDGTIQSWYWEFGDGCTSTSQNPTHQYTDDGTYYVNLTVTDNDGASSAVCQKTVVVSNVAPTANFTYSPANPTTLDIVNFTETSNDPDGTIITWFWEFGDGATSSLQNPTHQYSNAGT